MTEITVRMKEERAEAWVFEVTLSERGESTIHTVTLKRPEYQRLSPGRVTPERLVEASFQFLLEREPKESILRRFDLPRIGDYFPEYEEEIRKRLRFAKP